MAHYAHLFTPIQIGTMTVPTGLLLFFGLLQ